MCWTAERELDIARQVFVERGRQCIIHVLVAVHGQGHLVQVIGARDAVGRLTDLLHRGEQERVQDADASEELTVRAASP